jgi:hypothetical protein
VHSRATILEGKKIPLRKTVRNEYEWEEMEKSIRTCAAAKKIPPEVLLEVCYKFTVV